MRIEILSLRGPSLFFLGKQEVRVWASSRKKHCVLKNGKKFDGPSPGKQSPMDLPLGRKHFTGRIRDPSDASGPHPPTVIDWGPVLLVVRTNPRKDSRSSSSFIRILILGCLAILGDAALNHGARRRAVGTSLQKKLDLTLGILLGEKPQSAQTLAFFFDVANGISRAAIREAYSWA